MARRLSRDRLKVELASGLLSIVSTETDGELPAVKCDETIRIERDRLGKPELYIGASKGPEISFSYTSDTIWAAICPEAAGLGIDAAGPSEFAGYYPFGRVFHTEELDTALPECQGKKEEAAAFLWSVKEALLKALGCGFHLLDPSQVRICESVRTQEGFECSVRLTDEAMNKFPELDRTGFPVSIIRWGEYWVSISALSERVSAVSDCCLEVSQSLKASENSGAKCSVTQLPT